MKQELLKKTSLAILLMGVMMFSVSIAHAQIIYTDIPDTVITCTATNDKPCSSTYQLDLNSDGILDFKFDYYYTVPLPRRSYESYVSVSPLGNNKVASYDGNVICPLALTKGVVVKNNSWYGNSGQKLDHIKRSGRGLALIITCRNWASANNKYLGLKLTVGSNTYYGWVRLDVAPSVTSFTIKDYAYNTIPNQPILAGETSCIAPTLNVTASGPLSFCNGESVQLNAVADSAYLFQWYRNNNLLSNATSNFYKAALSGTYQVNAVNSCGEVRSRVDTVMVFADPSVTVSGKTFTANAINAAYQWIDCSTKQSISGATAKSFSPSIDGSYAVIIAENGCSDTSLCYTFCNSIIDTSVTVSGTTLTANAAGATYQWINCFWREPVVGANAKAFSPKFSGTYAVIVIVNGICKDTSSCYAITATGNEESIFAAAINLYPNPARSQVTIDFEINNNRVDVQIFDLNGKMVYAKTTNSTQIEIDTKEFVEGVYVVRIQTENYLITKKLVIEK